METSLKQSVIDNMRWFRSALVQGEDARWGLPDVEWYIRGPEEPPNIKGKPRSHRYAQQDLWNLLTIMCQIEWLHQQSREKALESGAWMAFAQCNVDLFHIEARAFFDHVANTISLLGTKKRQVPDSSFHALVEWLNQNPSRRDLLPAEIVKLVFEVHGPFERIRFLRDELVHNGAQSLVFPDMPEIGFVITKHYTPLYEFPDWVRVNENVVDFRLYAAVMMLNLLRFWHGLQHAIRDSMRSTPGYGEMKVTWSSSGLGLLLDWCQRLEAKLSS